MIKVTCVAVLFLVTSVQCTVQQKSSNNYVSVNGISNWRETDDNYRWNDNHWKLSVIPTLGIRKSTRKENDVFRENSRKLEDQFHPMMHWNKNPEHQFRRNRFTMNDKRRYPSVNYWTQIPNKLIDWHVDSIEDNGYKYMEPQYQSNPSQNTAYQNEHILWNNNARPEGIKQVTTPWYQLDNVRNIWISAQKQPINLKADITSSIVENERSTSNRAVSPGYITPSSGENTKHSFSTTRDIAVLMPYSVPVAVPKPLLVPIAVPVVHNIPFPVEKPVPYPVISEVPQPYEKLVPMRVEVPKIVPIEVPVYTHIYKGTNSKKWHMETKL